MEINGLPEYVAGAPQSDRMYYVVAYGMKFGNEASISQTISAKSGFFYMHKSSVYRELVPKPGGP